MTKLQLDGDISAVVLEQAETGSVHFNWIAQKALAGMTPPAVFQRLPASPDIPAGPSLMPEHGSGFHGIAQIEAHCTATQRRVRLGRPVLEDKGSSLCVTARDAALGIEVATAFSFSGDALVVNTTLTHTGNSPIDIRRAASALLPAPDWAAEIITHSGAWGREGHEERRKWDTGRIEQLGRGGRPGFDGGPTLSLTEPAGCEIRGRWLTLHLAWSGPFTLAAERATDGSAQILAERRFAPGEIRLNPGASMALPEAMLALSGTGRNQMRTTLNTALRKTGRTLVRPVHFNTWEARYFEVDEASCIALAKDAAALGAERFVLDDGWFKGRRNDQTSLGDWTVDTAQFPNGLGPLIDAVKTACMEFGLWLEPEMVSPDSDLYRAHPDWVLGWPDAPLATGRNQLVLDLALPEVCDHLFTSIAALLDTYEIGYLKWDCNRDLYPATRDGVERPGAQTEALYSLLDRLRAAYPVEIESCASGGGRIDAGIARRTDRFWASDATDAIDRLRIQRAAGLIMPQERLGCHVGPSPNPMTGRQLPMSFRVLAAFFGHFGIEADPARFSDTERAILKRGIDLYKAHRHWMHAGQLVMASDPADDPDVQIVISDDQSRALVRIMRTDTPKRPLQPRLRLTGLDHDTCYSLVEFALEGEPVEWPLGEYSGLGLMTEGLNLDPGRALTGRLIYLERTG
ncbi:alpha-galactosidase [Maricaulis sp.]|uniref:alpha-galactosidase n=1 Tax=Maricaulis sp. TaxID=1486257 RepID=UPI002630CCF9|nr:alpha-galactosidase [Maricaulis sp.]